MKKICLSQTVYSRIFIYSAILALTGLFCTPHLDAEIYKWIDENGEKHYSNMPPANAGDVEIVFGEIQHDEAADQEPVKADQIETDALVEKNEKEKRQTSEMPTAIGSEPPIASNNMNCPQETSESGSFGELITCDCNLSDNSYWYQTQATQARTSLISASQIANVVGLFAHTLICH